MPDDGFHEIQLNGKQLVFLFMAATVVSVVIFLCGVLVGRGVRSEQGAVAETAALSEVPTADVAATSSRAPNAVSGSDPRVAAPPPTVDDLSYFNRLEQRETPPEELKPASGEASRPELVTRSPSSPAQPLLRETEIASVGAGSLSKGYAVQLAALNSRSEADAMAERLTAKGYAAYVLVPPRGAPAVYRVRIGTFSTRRDAESVAAKLQKEEQFQPWITR